MVSLSAHALQYLFLSSEMTKSHVDFTLKVWGWGDATGKHCSTWLYQPPAIRTSPPIPTHHNDKRDGDEWEKQRPGWQLINMLLCCTASMPGQESSDRLHLLILDCVTGPNRQIGWIQTMDNSFWHRRVRHKCMQVSVCRPLLCIVLVSSCAALHQCNVICM